jgi:RNA polymerase sigma factor (sigma-70 family)
MAANPLVHCLEYLRRSVLRPGAEQIDGQLLEAFIKGRDSQALETLVRRHAPMVWGVCRRTLSHHHDAEDAFQATFLVLVRKAASIRSRELLANWLHGVAHKTACKARQMAAKRSVREKQVSVMPEPQTEAHDPVFGRELRALLDEELNRLPKKYRIAILLCDLAGRNRAEVARQLRLPEGTVGSRLSRGRALLAKRLARRGVTVSATALATVLGQQAASAAVPAALLAATIKAVTLFVAGEVTVAGVISGQVSALTDGVLKAIVLAKRQAAAVMLLMAALVLSGGLLTYHNLASPHEDPTRPAVGQAADTPQNIEVIKALKADINRFGKEDAAKTFAIHSLFGRMPGLPEILQFGAIRAEKATLDQNTGHWFVTGIFEHHNWPGKKSEPATNWEAEVSFSPFAHAWQWHMKKPEKERFRNQQPAMPVTFADLHSMSEMGFADGRKVTDEDFRFLHGLKALRTLKLGWINDRWLNELKDLPNLRTLILANCMDITNKSLAAIGKLPALEKLDLSGTPITDAGLEYLAKSRKLRTLNLAGTTVTDKGLKHLKRIKTLSSLDLSPGAAPPGVFKPLITDAALTDFKEFKSLKSLTLSIILMTGDGSVNDVKKFREAMDKALPGCANRKISIITKQEMEGARRPENRENTKPVQERPK